MSEKNKKSSIDVDAVRERARTALGKIKPADHNTQADKDFLFKAQRSDAGRSLPPYYLVYFLLVDLLGFKDLGKFEKISWSIPIDYNGEAFLIEYRKFGVGVFIKDKATQENEAAEIVKLIQKAISIAQPYFKFLAEEAISRSEFNLTNKAPVLFGRFEFFLTEYRASVENDLIRRNKRKEQEMPTDFAAYFKDMIKVTKKTEWLALAAIDAFYSWTEHIFIHIAILRGEITSGQQVADLIGAEWAEKFKKALSIKEKQTKIFFDKLCTIRKQLRNFIAHGAFGKEGEAFRFHSGTGAVPVKLDTKAYITEFSIRDGTAFNNAEAISIIEEFIKHLWSGEREPARLYIQESELPIVLTYATDGRYALAMTSVKEMQELIEWLEHQLDQAANMDW